MFDKKNLELHRDSVHNALDVYERTLKEALQRTPRGSGHAENDYDHLKKSITQVESAKRVLFMDN